MNGREFEEKNEKITHAVGETPEAFRTETILRRAASWEAETPEPVGLAYRALTKKGVLRGGDRRRFFPVRHWWGIGTLGVASALAVLVYAHPVPFDVTADDATTRQPTPLTQKASSPQSHSAKAQRIFSLPTPDAGATEKNEATKSVVRPEAVPTVAVVKSPRSSAHRGVRRRIPETTYRPRNRTSLAHNRHPNRHYEAAHPAAPLSAQTTGKETTEAPQLAANPAPTDAAPAPSDCRLLVPVVLTHESEDGSEIIATPAVMEVAYEQK